MKTEHERRRDHEQTRPKNAGVHADQLKKQATRANRRAYKQEMRIDNDHN